MQGFNVYSCVTYLGLPENMFLKIIHSLQKGTWLREIVGRDWEIHVFQKNTSLFFP